MVGSKAQFVEGSGELRLLRVRMEFGQKDVKEWFYVAKTYNSITLTRHIDNAYDYGCDSVSEVVGDYKRLVTQHGDKDVEHVIARTHIEIETVDMEDGDFLEERRRLALNKLGIDDIKVLGLEKLATYHKLRYENANDQTTAFAAEPVTFETIATNNWLKLLAQSDASVKLSKETV